MEDDPWSPSGDLATFRAHVHFSAQLQRCIRMDISSCSQGSMLCFVCDGQMRNENYDLADCMAHTMGPTIAEQTVNLTTSAVGKLMEDIQLCSKIILAQMRRCQAANS